jgi:hypothetical protein
MALSTITTSDLTSEPEDLTVIHEQSGLPGTHEDAQNSGRIFNRIKQTPKLYTTPCYQQTT